MINPLRKYIEKVIWQHSSDITTLEKQVFDNISSVRKEMKEINKDINTYHARIEAMGKKLTDLESEINLLPSSLWQEIDRYVQSSVKQVVSQGSKCSTKLDSKINAKQQTFEQKVTEAQGKIKRELPVIRERLGIIEDRLKTIEGELGVKED